jgi:ABC-2 type transport system permease protein
VVTIAFIVFMPISFYIAFGLAYRAFAGDWVENAVYGLTQANFSFAGTMVFSLMAVFVANVGISVAMRRDHGAFKRLRTTPVPPWVVMGALVANAVLTAVILTAAMVLIGTGMMGVRFGADRLPVLGAAWLVCAFCFVSLGLGLSLVPRSAESSVPILNGIFFPLAFLSGAFFEIPADGFWGTVVGLLPGRPAMELFMGGMATVGPSWSWIAALKLAVWAVIGLAAVSKWFRWSTDRETGGKFGSERKRPWMLDRTGGTADSRNGSTGRSKYEVRS